MPMLYVAADKLDLSIFLAELYETMYLRYLVQKLKMAGTTPWKLSAQVTAG